MLRQIKLASLGVVVVSCALAAPAAWASEIVHFTAFPGSPPTLPDVQLVGAGVAKALVTGPDFQSSGDGLLPPANQQAPGMDITTPFTIPGIPGGVIDGNGATDFYDSQMNVSNLNVNGLAQAVPVGGGNVLDVQNYGVNATFALVSTNAAGPQVPLLTGIISSATLTGLQGTTATSVLSGTVTYTGGVIFAALLAHGGSANGGDMSISMLNLTDPASGLPVGLSIANDGYIADVNASATGLFDAPTPEPSTLALAGLALVPLMRRVRR
jgi:hypothetical protein